jgi:hypothetical protein
LPINTKKFRTSIGYRALRHVGWAIAPVLCAGDAVRGRKLNSPKKRSAAAAYAVVADTRLVIVTPNSEHDSETWKPGGGNYFFELFTSAQEAYGEKNVEVFLVDEIATPETWHASLVQHLISTRASHCLAFVESDPGQAGPWHWNDFALRARHVWSGAFIGVLTDGVYLLHQLRATRFRRAMPHSIFVAIDVESSSYAGYVPARTIFGPCFLPISDASIEALSDSTAISDEREFDLVFVGKVYPNREGFLDELRSSGLRIGINPHRQDPAVRPGYGDYVRGLRQGLFTLNLSEAGGMPVPQLKSRMLEGPLFGTIVCTDESSLARRFFDTDQFVTFATAGDLQQAITGLLANPQKLVEVRAAAQDNARTIASGAFWTTAERGLVENHLPNLGTRSVR